MKTRNICVVAVAFLIIAVSVMFYFNYFEKAEDVFEGTLVRRDPRVRKASRNVKKMCRNVERKAERGIENVADFVEDCMDDLEDMGSV